MNRDDILKLSPGRELDCLVLEKVLGYECKELNPAWYNIPVKCYYLPTGGYVQYSFDENACNAMMFRNGENANDGYAPPVPDYSTDIAAAWGVVELMVKRMNDYPVGHFNWTGPLYKPNSRYLTHEGYPLGTVCWYVILEADDIDRIVVCGDTATEVICKAALLCKIS